MQDSHFTVDQGLLQTLILVKHLQIITYCLLTVCADVAIFFHEISYLGVHISVAWSDHYCLSPTYAVVTFRKIWHKLNFMQVETEYSYMWSAVYLCLYTRESTWNPYSSTMEPSGTQHVIAHQCSARSISQHFHSHKQKFGAPLKNVIISNFYYL